MNYIFIYLIFLINIGFSLPYNSSSQTANNSTQLSQNSSGGKQEWFNKLVNSQMIKPDINKAKIHAWYASAALCSEKSLKQWGCKACSAVPGAKFISYFNHFLLGTSGYLIANDIDQALILSFRGTENLMNWISDILITQSTFKSINDKDARVHSGFLGAMESLSGSFIKEVNKTLTMPQYSSYKIKVIGHSMGGAMAVLASIKLKSILNLNWDRFEVYTYGQPRTGNKQFVEWFDNQPIALARSVNFDDPVPRLPPNQIFNYAHHGNELFINSYNPINPRYCNSNLLEDPSCAMSITDKLLKSSGHVSYYTVPFDKKGAC